MRSNGGTQAQSELANKDKLYKQTYCGCQFALNKQREKQRQIPLELMSNIGKQIMPGSNEQRKLIFEIRDKCESEGREYALYKRSKILWRNLRSVCMDNGEAINISIDDINLLLKTHYKDTQEMVYNPPAYECELLLRAALCGADSLNPIIVLDKCIKYSLRVFIDAYFQESSVFAITTY